MANPDEFSCYAAYPVDPFDYRGIYYLSRYSTPLRRNVDGPCFKAGCGPIALETQEENTFIAGKNGYASVSWTTGGSNFGKFRNKNPIIKHASMNFWAKFRGLG